VILACRNATKGEAACAKIIKEHVREEKRKRVLFIIRFVFRKLLRSAVDN